MALNTLLPALGLIVAASPVSAASEYGSQMTPAPAGTSDTRYCMRIEVATGSHIERVMCWTREDWAQEGVDVDRDWAREGVRTID